MSSPTSPVQNGIVDCDIHPVCPPELLKTFLPAKWHEMHDLYRGASKGPFFGLDPYAGIEPNISRRDAYPPGGGIPGTDLAFMQEQYLNPHNVEIGLLQPLSPTGGMQRHLDLGVAMASAVNDWQLERWSQEDNRLRTSITVTQDHTEAAVAEINRLGKNPLVAQVGLLQRNTEPAGRRRYWPIYKAAVEHGLPIGVHVGGNGGTPPMGNAGWASYHVQQHQLTHGGFTAFAMSMIMEGVFEEFPDLKLLLVEGAFTWVPSTLWRLDKLWETMRSEVPNLKRKPSEYFASNVYVSTQPMDVYKNPADLRQIMEWVGWDNLCFASDYPHWDFDDPRYVFTFPLSAEERRKVFSDNARKFLRL